MNILGINAYHANASAALICDGRLVTAVEEERFNRVKYAAGFPASAVRHCLSEAGLTLKDIDHVAVPRNPWARLATKLFYAVQMPRFTLDRYRALKHFRGIQEDLAAAFEVDPKTIRVPIHRVEHHVAHLASAFLVSPFDRAAVLSTDGLGDFASTMWATGEGNRLNVHGSVAFPHSLGLFYTALSQYLGFWKFGDEYKVMGLAAYGEPKHVEELRRIVKPNDGKGFSLGLDYFCHHKTGPEMTWQENGKTPVLGRLFSPYLEERLGKTRTADEPVGKKHQDIAASMQVVLEEAYFRLLNHLYQIFPQSKICLAGGVAFNCVANGKIFDHTPFSQVYVQPAAGDAGLSVGAAYYVYHQILGQPRSFIMDHAYWGPQFTPEAIAQSLENSPVRDLGLAVQKLSDEELVRLTAQTHCRRQDCGMVSGPRRVGPAGFGQPQHPRGPATGGNERYPQPENQAPRDVSALCAFGSGRSHRRVLRALLPFSLHEPRVCSAPRKAGHDSRSDACGWNRPSPDREPSNQSSILGADQGIRKTHRCAGALEYFL